MTQEQIYEKINEVVQTIGKNFQPEKIILFGSYAWSKPGQDSDVDLLVVKDTDKPRIERERELNRLLFPRPFPIDLLVYTRTELEVKINKDRNLFLEDIIRNGKILYSRPGSGEIRIEHTKPLTIVP